MTVQLIVEDKFLPDSEVKQKDFLDLYKLKQWQLEKMIAFGMKKGFFKFKSFIYQLYIDDKKVQPVKEDQIILPVVTKDGRKVRLLIDNVIKEDNVPPKNTYKAIMNIFGEDMSREDFKRRVNVSQNYLETHASNAKSFTINGVLVKVSRITKVMAKFDVRNTLTGHTSFGLTHSEVIAKTACKKVLLTQIEKFGFSCEYRHFVIGREKVC